MSARTTDEIKAEIAKTAGLLKTLRDEAKVKIHLAKMDIKTTWNELQPKLAEAEQDATRAAEHASEATLEAMKTTARKLQKVLDSI
jgi:lipid II:glycine glycyltransferase (peptidoglycan interpeptide bridge formation enzyme)